MMNPLAKEESNNNRSSRRKRTRPNRIRSRSKEEKKYLNNRNFRIKGSSNSNCSHRENKRYIKGLNNGNNSRIIKLLSAR
jgi:hypothetical protein